jgi:quinol monooxygenase YgiN
MAPAYGCCRFSGSRRRGRRHEASDRRSHDAESKRGRLPDLPLWSQGGAEDPALFLLYIEWRDKAAFDAHVAAPHVRKTEQRIDKEKLLTKPAGEWHFYRL